MRILNVSAQKPNSTGSGVYMTELINSFALLGCENALVCGISKGEVIKNDNVRKVFPVFFETDTLPFPVVGMSDSMPYKSTRYRDMTKAMQDMFEKAFIARLREAINEFKPDIILCHHLYFLTALIREYFPDEKIGAVCHGTDLRQFLKINLQNERIKKNIQKLDVIFSLHESQRDEISSVFQISKDKIFTIGTGYNKNIFNNHHYPKRKDRKEIIYAGKICDKKGVSCLIKAFGMIETKKDISLCLAGGYSDKEEYERIRLLGEKEKRPVSFLGKLNQKELSESFNRADIFVLPSFFEGLPLVLAEALSCGLKVIATDLPGVREWIDNSIRDNGIIFITPPIMENVDEPKEKYLPQFINELKAALQDAVNDDSPQKYPNTEAISWDNVAAKVLEHF